MHKLLTLLLCAGTLAAASSANAAVSSPREIDPFDAAWRFKQADVANGQDPALGDHDWEQVNLPHDWSIAGPFDPKNPSGEGGGYLPTGIAWYRKAFHLPESASGRRVFIEFDGVMQNSDVWINGQHLGHRPSGYVSFRYDLTGHLNFGPHAENLVAVRADTSAQPASRWYAGSGIYRHVRLIVTDPVHVDTWATFASSRSVSAESALVQVETSVVNQTATTRTASVEFTLLAPDGSTVATMSTSPQSLPPEGTVSFKAELPVRRPALWDLGTPRLYQAIATVHDGGKNLDSDVVSFGIRDAHFESASGFWLNGRNVRLYGVCLHEDGGAFGAAVPAAFWEQWLTTLRSLGVNAIRTAHNPPSPVFLDVCDRMGFLVMDEMFDCWTVGKNPYDYHLYFNEWSKRDVRDSVRRDRNHPSIVLYSAGNEIHDTPNAKLAKSILAGLVAVFHENDPTRPVTQALFRPNVSHDYTNGLADLLDVIGTNYRDNELNAAWAAKPGRKIVGTEQRHDRETWLELREHPAEAGQFLWTGVDYLGESGHWPMIALGSGLLDRTGTVRALGRERQSWWTTAPMIAIARRVAPDAKPVFDPGYEPTTVAPRHPQVLFSDWSPRNLAPHEESVEVYSNCETVELFLNGVSLGAQPIDRDARPRVWKVRFAPGTLRAVGRNGNNTEVTEELKTPGLAKHIVLQADRATVSPHWEDVVRVTATVVDATGTTVATGADLISFTASGPGAIVAVDNGDNASHEPFQATQRHAFEGQCVAYVRATADHGDIRIKASAPGLEAGTVSVAATAGAP